MPTASVMPTFDWSQAAAGLAGAVSNPFNVPVRQAQTVATAAPYTNLTPQTNTAQGGNSLYGGTPMTTQPVSPTGSTTPTPTGGGPSGPSGQTGQQTAYQIPGTQAQGGSYFGWSPPAWMSDNSQANVGSDAYLKAIQNYVQNLPYYQLQQNAYQYGMDFNEAQRRWDQQFGWTQQNDQFNQNLANQQQQMAQWVAQQQQNNWGQQFGLDSEMARGNLGVSQAEQQSQDWYRRQQATLADMTQYQLDQWRNKQLALDDLTQYQLDQYRKSQLAQEGALTRENYQNQQAIARMNAFGRTQAPRARWVRSW